MADLRGDREGSANVTELSCSSGGNGRSETATPHQLMVSGSFTGDGKGPRRRKPFRSSLDADKFINLLHGSDPVKVELNRLENEVRDKDRELGEAQAEMKALRRILKKSSESIKMRLLPEVVLKRLDEQGRMIESLHSSVAMYKRLYEEQLIPPSLPAHSAELGSVILLC